MLPKFCRLVGCLCVVGSCLLSQSFAAEPLWQKLIPGSGVEADPNKDYWMTEENGPWLILATTFSGEGAMGQARELVLELRRRYKLEAYMHEMTFDFSDGVVGRGVDRTGQPKRMQYRRNDEIREIAVLVGNYPSVSDVESQESLQQIKYLRPDSLDPAKRGKTNQTLANLRRIQAALLPKGDQRKKRGPMGHAFITRNPMLPKEYFVPSGLDPEVADWNRSVKHSLLECPGKFSVKVATLTGRIVLDQKKVQDFERGLLPKEQSKLEKAAEDAHRLTLALREKGYDAYQFHDRYASMVTVGSFGSVGDPRSDGKIEIDPQIHKIMKTFSARPERPDPNGQAVFVPRRLAGVLFDMQPQIVQVPKETISTAFAR